MMRFLFLAISRSIRGLYKGYFCQRFSAEKRSPRLLDAAGRILLPKFSVCEKGRPLDFFELMRKVRADSPTATICLRNSAYMFFRFLGIARLGFTSKAENTPRCFFCITCVLRVAHHYLECCFSKPIPPPKVQKTNSRIFDPLRKTESDFPRLLCGELCLITKPGKNIKFFVIKDLRYQLAHISVLHFVHERLHGRKNRI